MTTEQYQGASYSGEARQITIDHARDALLTDFGKATLTDRYLQKDETFQGMFARVAVTYSESDDHAQRLYDYMSQLWFMPATPVLSNAGTKRGLPISCFLNSAEDTLDSIINVWTESDWLAARGGGIGTCWSKVRSIGEPVGDVGQTSGVIPFIRVQDANTLAISQGSLRRGSSAAYLDISHPEIEEFLEIRKPSGDANRKALNIHHGVTIPDDFMYAVKHDDQWDLISPKTGNVVKSVSARALWEKILRMRIQTGEPYILFSDTVNANRPAHVKKLGMEITQSNLCSEITLPTGVDYLGNERTAVCCLSSLNLEKYDEWNDNGLFIKDVFKFLDDVLSDFIARTDGAQGFERARYSAEMERSVGLGMMGWHSYCQKMNFPLESLASKIANRNISQHVRQMADKVNVELAAERGACPDAQAAGEEKRFSHMMAIAPTASISIICGGTSAGIEPIPANIYTHKTLSGSFTVKNKRLQELLADKGKDDRDVWESILANEGSVQHLDFLTDDEKAIYKTAFEIDQRWIVDLAADRAPFIDQAVSNNLFFPGNVDVRDLHFTHWVAWERGVKSLYYCRSRAVQRAEKISHFAGEMPNNNVPARLDYEECLVCQ